MVLVSFLVGSHSTALLVQTGHLLCIICSPQSCQAHLQQRWVPVKFNALLQGTAAPRDRWWRTGGGRVQHQTKQALHFHRAVKIHIKVLSVLISLNISMWQLWATMTVIRFEFSTGCHHINWFFSIRIAGRSFLEDKARLNGRILQLGWEFVSGHCTASMFWWRHLVMTSNVCCHLVYVCGR